MVKDTVSASKLIEMVKDRGVIMRGFVSTSGKTQGVPHKLGG